MVLPDKFRISSSNYTYVLQRENEKQFRMFSDGEHPRDFGLRDQDKMESWIEKGTWTFVNDLTEEEVFSLYSVEVYSDGKILVRTDEQTFLADDFGHLEEIDAAIRTLSNAVVS